VNGPDEDVLQDLHRRQDGQDGDRHARGDHVLEVAARPWVLDPQVGVGPVRPSALAPGGKAISDIAGELRDGDDLHDVHDPDEEKQARPGTAEKRSPARPIIGLLGSGPGTNATPSSPRFLRAPRDQLRPGERRPEERDHDDHADQGQQHGLGEVEAADPEERREELKDGPG